MLVKGNKVYSSTTCCFLPYELNHLFKCSRRDLPPGVSISGDKFQVHCSSDGNNNYLGIFKNLEEAFDAYKTAKETEIKRMADKFKSQLTPECYQAMYKYQVEIID